MNWQGWKDFVAQVQSCSLPSITVLLCEELTAVVVILCFSMDSLHENRLLSVWGIVADKTSFTSVRRGLLPQRPSISICVVGIYVFIKCQNSVLNIWVICYGVGCLQKMFLWHIFCWKPFGEQPFLFVVLIAQEQIGLSF